MLKFNGDGDCNTMRGEIASLPSFPFSNFGGQQDLEVKTMSCETCKNKPATPESIPYIAHEFAMARAERTAKRLWITILTLIFLLVGSNCAWLWYNAQFETVETITEEYQADASDGGNAIINGDGSVDIDG